MTGSPRHPGRSPQQRRDDLDQSLARLHAAVTELRTSQGWQAWLDLSRHMPGYSVGNQLLIGAQRPDATMVAGFTTWKALGRYVRKGETGIRILAPCTRRTSRRADDPRESRPARDPQRPREPGEPADGVDRVERRGQDDRPDAPDPGVRVVSGFRTVSVFDVAQTDGEPLPAAPRVDLLDGHAPTGLWEDLAAQVTTRGFTLARVADADAIGGANGVTDFHSRQVLVRSDVSDAQAVKTLAHELAHVMLHDPSPTAIDPAVESSERRCRGLAEVEAESVAYLITAHAGLDSRAYSLGYLAGWSDSLSDTALLACAARITQTASTVLDAIAAPPSAADPAAVRPLEGPTPLPSPVLAPSRPDMANSIHPEW